MDDLKVLLDKLRQIDYTALDYETIQAELIDYIKTSASNQGIVDDFLSGDAAKVFIDLFSYIGDILAFRIDTLANEVYLPTAQRRQSIINILEPLGQQPKNPTYAQLSLSVVPISVSPNEISLGKRYAITTTGLDGSDITFEIMNGPTDYFSDVIIPAGVTNYTVTAYSGNYKSFDIISPGTPLYKITLPEYPVIDGSVKVSVTPVDPFLLTPEIIEASRAKLVDVLTSDLNEIIYTVKYDEDGKAILTFAPSNFGKIPPKDYTIHVDYRTGGGKNTNVGTNAIEVTITATDSAGNPVDVIISNPDTFATGGEDKEDLDKVRIEAPARIRANNNLVTTQDYESEIRKISGVQDVFVVDAYTDITVFGSKFGVPDNSNFIWVLPNTGGEISPDLRALIDAVIEEKRLTAIENFVFNPIYNDWELVASITVKPTANIGDVKQNAINALLNKFGKEKATFNNQVRLSVVISTLQQVDGVDYVSVSTPQNDLVATENMVLRLLESNISITVQ